MPGRFHVASELGSAWWRGLSLDRHDAGALPRAPGWQQRLGKLAVAGVIAFLISIFVNVLEASFGSTRQSVDPHLRRLCVPRVPRRRPDLRARVGQRAADREDRAPARRRGARDHVPVLVGPHVHDPDLRRVPDGRDGGRDARLHHDGGRAEHRRRLRGPARPRLRRVLRHGRVHRRLARLDAVRGAKCPKAGFGIDNCPCDRPGGNFHFGAVGVTPGIGGIHISIWLAPRSLAGVSPRWSAIVIGLPTLRLRGDYLAIVTLGFGEIIPQIARNGDNLGGFNLTERPAAGSRRSTRPASATTSRAGPAASCRRTT